MINAEVLLSSFLFVGPNKFKEITHDSKANQINQHYSGVEEKLIFLKQTHSKQRCEWKQASKEIKKQFKNCLQCSNITISDTFSTNLSIPTGEMLYPTRLVICKQERTIFILVEPEKLIQKNENSSFFCGSR